ncbi:MAG: 23S rRNA (adenine(2503)-C(2))-methyltransferase RlmN [Sphaerochaetaceae bacterium]
METLNKMPLSLYGLDSASLCQVLQLEKPYMGKQIYSWLVKGAKTFSDMTNLSKFERERLTALMPSYCSSTVKKTEQDDDATKLGIELYDGSLIECVVLTDKNGRHTACLSSQVGCAMGCAFCRTGTMGFTRNLVAEEIIEQFIHLSRIVPISHIVFMGMGEPMNNIQSVLKAIRYFHDPEGFDISLRRITISTCGVVPGINKISEQKLPVRLAISLVSADNDLRDKIMPVNRTWDLADLKQSLERYQHNGGKRFTFEYCMLHGVNTTESSAKKLASYTRDMDVVINLIPYNDTADLKWETPSKEETDRFCSYLEKMRVKYTLRISRGGNISGACGQLATRSLQEQENEDD